MSLQHRFVSMTGDTAAGIGSPARRSIKQDKKNTCQKQATSMTFHGKHFQIPEVEKRLTNNTAAADAKHIDCFLSPSGSLRFR